MDHLDQDALFTALTRPQMLAGVTYSYCIVNGIVTTELFLIFKALWVLAFAITLHLIGYLACLREPRFLDIWLVKTSQCQRIPNFSVWQCNSYRP